MSPSRPQTSNMRDLSNTKVAKQTKKGELADIKVISSLQKEAALEKDSQILTQTQPDTEN